MLQEVGSSEVVLRADQRNMLSQRFALPVYNEAKNADSKNVETVRQILRICSSSSDRVHLSVSGV